MARRPMPIFDYAKCKSSGLCVALCPTECLDMWNDRPSLLKPQACVSCGVCEIVCPTGAVTVADGTPQRPQAK